MSLVIDAATFAASALIVRIGVRARPAPASGGHHQPSRLAGIIAGTRLVFVRPALRTPMFFGWLAAFYNAPEGVATPLAHELHGGAAAVGVILAAEALGETTGAIVFSRFLTPPTRQRVMGPFSRAGVERAPSMFRGQPQWVSRMANSLSAVGRDGFRSRVSPSGCRAWRTPCLRLGQDWCR